MNTNHFLLILILIPGMMKAQLNEHFTDGDFTSNPSWSGDVQQFKVNSSYHLQLNSSGENSSCLATAISASDSMEWNFWVKQSFSPSDNNLSKIYLLSDQQDLKGSLNGYYLKLGESGSNDAIELVKQSGTVNTSLCKGTTGLIASSFAIRIKVTRSAGGAWNIMADPEGGDNYGLEAAALDNTYSSGGWFGFFCRYTSSNSTKFLFDDIYAGPVREDTVPPEALSVSVLSSNSLKLQFSEKVDPGPSLLPANYTVDRQVGNPLLVQPDTDDHSIVYLTFSSSFLPDVPYKLSISNIRDPAGNSITPIQLPFGFHEVHSFDVLINEVMCDPNTPASFPNLEFIELFNRASIPIDLAGWSISIGSVAKDLPSFLLDAGKYVILSQDEAKPYLEPLGPVISFSSFALLNTGTTLTLRNANGGIVHSISYTDDWYRSDYKKEGGWSLELIDPQNPCGEAGNWMASNDPGGCTPGKVNSVISDNPDIQLPRITRVGILDLYQLKLTFNETLDSTALNNPNNYFIDNDIGIPVSATALPPAFRQVNILLGHAIEKEKIYTLTITGTVTDCAGNMLLANNSSRFAFPEAARLHDLVINEILFDPLDGCVDFVEVYNRSNRVLDLYGFTLATYDTLRKELDNISDLSSESILALPGDYYALTIDTSALGQCHMSSTKNGFILLENTPPMNNDAGSIALALKNGEIIDNFSYTADMHYPLLNSSEGVSLERISPERPASDRSNWHSAAESAGYATPASKNSQYAIVGTDANEISLSPGIFSPDNDGHDDVLNIAYTFSTPGNNITVTVFDASGHLVRNLVSNELCGTSGAWSWDGINNKREKAPIGRYIVFVEAFDMSGNVKKYKRAAVLGGKL